MFSIRLWQAALAAVTALPVVVALVYKSVAESYPKIGWGQAILAAALGLLCSLALFFLSVLAQLLVNSESRACELAKEVFIVQWLPDSVIRGLTRHDPAQAPRQRLRKLFWYVLGRGFFDENEGRFLSGHGFAGSLLVLSLLVFVVAGQFSTDQMPALFFVILLLQLLGWGLSALSFFFDRYRVPVLGVILLIAYASSPNYYYSVQNGRTLTPLMPEEVIGAGGADPRQIIVVATEGGGIQAAAWTARVLTGLQQDFPEFGKAVRLISSVSGGSTGALFFVNAYDPKQGVPDAQALDLVVQMAAEDSLDTVARSLVYHDFIHTILPFWEFGDDRGTALERSWALNCRKVCEEYQARYPGKSCPINFSMAGTLAEWAENVKAGTRPANIFNATVVENGDRLLVSNSDIKKDGERGRLNIAEFLGGKDIQALTSARLSATFPYVSPAARTEVNSPNGAKLHVVDGGYYDNYGMTSLVEWLDQALGDNRLGRVLVIQIQSFREDHSKDDSSGYISQLLAPLYTLLNIRTAAQASHKELEFSLLQDKWKGRVDSALFRFDCNDAPLTWKLTEREKQNIRNCWQQKYAGDGNYPTSVVKQFLHTMRQADAQTKSGQP